MLYSNFSNLALRPLHEPTDPFRRSEDNGAALLATGNTATSERGPTSQLWRLFRLRRRDGRPVLTFRSPAVSCRKRSFARLHHPDELYGRIKGTLSCSRSAQRWLNLQSQALARLNTRS